MPRPIRYSAKAEAAFRQPVPAIGVAPFGIDYADYTNYPLGARRSDQSMAEPYGKIYAAFRPMERLWATWSMQGRTHGIAESDERTPQTITLEKMDHGAQLAWRPGRYRPEPAGPSDGPENPHGHLPRLTCRQKRPATSSAAAQPATMAAAPQAFRLGKSSETGAVMPGHAGVVAGAAC